MNLVKFLVSLKERHIFITKNGDKLGVKGDRSAITADIKQELGANKQQILETYDALGISSNMQLAPTTFSQKRLWFLDQLEGSSAHYNMPGAIHFRGELDQSALQQAFNTILERHDSLRTVFFGTDEEPYQIIRTHKPQIIPFVDLVSLTDAEKRERIKEIDHNDINQSFDLAKDLMIRLCLVRLDPDEYVLYYCLHHIVSDGWSSGILENEFAVLYNAFQKQQPNPLPPLAIQYADYAHWQRDYFTGEVMQQQLDYWTNALRGIPAVHQLPLDFSRPKLQSYDGENTGMIVEMDVLNRFKGLCQQQGATLFMGLYSLLTLVLGRMSGEKDIVLGTPIANREQADVEPLIGFFLNSLVLRAQLDEGDTFASFLEANKKAILGAYEFQQVPFEEVVKQLRIPPSLSYSPVFQIMFVLQNNARGEESLEGVDSQTIGRNFTATKFDITFNCTETDEGLILAAQYNTSLFKAATMKRYLDAVHTLMHVVVENADAKLFELPLIADADREQVSALQRPQVSIDTTDTLVHHAFEVACEGNPTGIAVSVGMGDAFAQYRYEDINRQANQLARYLYNQGVGAGSYVGLSVRRSVDMVIAVLGILKAGAAYVPLDPEFPEERLRYMLSDAQVSNVVTQSRLLDILPIDEEQCICIDDASVKSALAELSGDNLQLAASNDSAAYVIYTSGSTGNPKGVNVTHKNWLSFHAAIQQDYGLDEKEIVLQFSTINFDIFIEELSVSILSGGTLAMPFDDKVPAFDAFWQGVAAHHISFASVPTAFWRYLSADKELPHYANATCLNTLIVGGEAMPLASLAQWQAAVSGNIRLFNTYGPTETTVVTVFTEVTDYPVSQGAVPIGQALANTGIYVLDEEGNETAVGAIGELFLSGDCVAQGYLHKPELTAERFIERNGERLYRTGDLVRLNTDWQLEFMGRNDDQVKVRGFRIELGEVENRVSQLASIQSSLVVTQTQESGEKLLVAYVIPEDNGIDTEQYAEFAAQVKAELVETLPNYMVPAFVVALQEWPLMPSGKIDRKALPAPDKQEAQAVYVAPTNAIEKKLVALWAELLALNEAQVSTNASFFELGGHSLLAVRLATEMREAFGVEMTVKTIFELMTIKRLASFVLADDGTSARTTIEPRPSNLARIPLSFAQQRLWFIDKLENGSPEYNITIHFMINGLFDVDAAESALKGMIARHEVLRTVFVEDEDGVQQRILNDYTFAVARDDLTNLSADVAEARFNAMMENDKYGVFDLSSDLMLRAHFVALPKRFNGEDKAALLLSMHHIAFDGWSSGILQREFFNLYEFYSGEPHRSEADPYYPLPALEIQYADYALWQRDWLQGEILESQLSYWENQLTGLPTCHSLPLDYPRPTELQHEGRGVDMVLSQETASQLLRVANKHQLTSFMLIHGLLTLTLARYSNQKDIVIGTPYANRLQTEVSPLLGFFVNTVVLRSHTDHTDFNAFFAHIRETHLSAQANQDVPFEQVVERLSVPRDPAITPLFQIMLATTANYKPSNNHQEVLSLGQTRFTSLTPEVNTSKFDVSIDVEISELGGCISWFYDVSLFSHEHMQRLCGFFKNVLDNFAILSRQSGYAAAPLTDLALFSADQEHALETQSFVNEASQQQASALQQAVEHSCQFPVNDWAGWNNNDLSTIVEHIHSSGKDTLSLTAPQLMIFAHYVERQELHFAALKRVIVTSMPTVLTSAMRSFFAEHPAVEFVSCWIKPELGVIAQHVLPNNIADWRTMIPMGNASGISALVLGEDGLPLANGVKGRLHLVIPNHLQAQFAAEKLQSITLPQCAERLVVLPTSSIVKRYENGVLDWVGQRTQHALLNRFNLDTSEVLEKVMLHHGVESAYVTVSDCTQEPALLIYIRTHSEDGSHGFQSIQAALKHEFSMLPIDVYFTPIDHWELDEHGDIDTNAFPAVDELLNQHTHIASRNEVEKDLLAIWANLLPVSADKISVDDNFFALGGHSLLFAMLAQRIQAKFTDYPKVTLNDLFKVQTIEEQALLITGEMDADIELLDCLTDEHNASLDSIFAVPGVAGMANMFIDLSEALRQQYNVYAFNHQGMVDDHAAFTSIEENVSHFIALMKDVQPVGPYKLIGHSYGGALALEIALKLQQEGEQAQLVMLDTYLEQSTLKDIIVSENTANGAAASAKDRLSELPPWLTLDGSMRKKVRGIYKQQIALFDAYQPQQAIELPVGFIGCQNAYYQQEAYLQRLQAYCNQPVNYAQVSGDHFSMLKRQGAQEITQVIKEWFAK